MVLVPWLWPYLFEGWPVPLRVEERRRGKSREMMGLIVGREAQIMAVFTSMSDQIAESVLSPVKV